jgi:hypothetical protein
MIGMMRLNRIRWVGKPEQKRKLENSGRRWEHNIEIGHKSLDFVVVDRIQLAQGSNQRRAIVVTAINIQAP